MKSVTNDGENRAAQVPAAMPSPQAADIRSRWPWVERTVWTERMLTRLEQSEPTTKWFRLWDKVLDRRNLQSAFWAVWRNDGAPGVDGQTVLQRVKRGELDAVHVCCGRRKGLRIKIPASVPDLFQPHNISLGAV